MTAYSVPKQEALDLEAKVLEALLVRNWQAHKKTQYFRRLSMAAKWLRKKKILLIFPEIVSIEQEINRLKATSETRTRKSSQFWNFGTNTDSCSHKTQLEQRLKALVKVVPNIVDVIQRLEVAAKSLFQEAVRGFFLPIVTVALGCVARLRVLLQQLGLYALEYIPATMDSSNIIFGESKTPSQDASYGPIFLPSRMSSRHIDLPRNNNNVYDVLDQLGIKREGGARATIDTVQSLVQHEGDIGEAVRIPAGADEAQNVVGDESGNNQIDTNAEILSVIEQKQETKGKKKKKKKRNDCSPGSKTKRSKVDFFDDLFAQR